MSSAIGGLLTSLDGDAALYQLDVISLERAPTGSNEREPVEWEGDPTYGSGNMPEVDSPRFIAFSGRGTGNQQVRVFLYGWVGTSPDNFRIAAGDDATIEAAIATLTAVTNTFLTAGLNTPIWKPYVNVGFNAYFQRKQRLIA